MAILPAVTEELVYRGIVLNGLRSLGKWPAILLSALAFCLMHANIAQFTFTFFLGIVLGYIMFETSCLWLCMLTHFLNNATVLTIMYITQSSSLPTEITSSFLWQAICFFLLAIGVIILAFFLISFIKKKYQQKQSIQDNNIETNDNKEAPQQEKTTKSKHDLVMLCVGFGLAVLLTVIGYL